MYESPSSLEDLCLNTVCDNILNYVELATDYNNDNKKATAETTTKDKRYRFADSEIFLFKEISEKLLAKFVEKNMLRDSLMFLFDAKQTKLSSVKLRNCKVSPIGLQILKQHKIVDLECINLKNVCIGDILGWYGIT